MTNPVMLQHGKTKSAIRELFEYGLRQAAIVGKENVYDYSLGNPSVPAPAEIADTIRELMDMEPLALHGYTPASGVVYNRKALEELGALLTRKSEEIGHPIYIIADEPYRELTYDGEDAPYIPAIYPNTVICYS